MADFVEVARVADVPPGTRFFYDFAEDRVIVFNVDGEFYCVADLCSHDDGPLEDGDLIGYKVYCPRHGACFDIRTGSAQCLPATSPIPSYEVKVEDGRIFVQSPDW
jgi:3-phenylpropionate/trans-cinnamate dioxygenase ferredoxin subunit